MNQKSNPGAANTAANTDNRLQQLLVLLSLLKNARQKPRQSELEFLMVNQTFNLVRYRHCVYWQRDGENISIKAVSGLVQIDSDGPYALWLKDMLKGLIKSKKVEFVSPEDKEKKDEAIVWAITAEDCSHETLAEWKEWLSAYALLVTMKNKRGEISSGLLMDRDEPFDALEKAFLEDLGDAYAHVLRQFETGPSKNGAQSLWRAFFSVSQRKMRYALLGIALVLLCPVRTSTSAPAEVVAHKPYVVTIPFGGTIEEVAVSPGQEVKKGDLLIRMDHTVLQNKLAMADSGLEIATIGLRKTEREAMIDRSKLAELSILKSQLEQKSTEKEFAGELLARADIRAERDGVAVFADPNALRGKPVQTGEQVMLLADPQKSELLIRVPVDSMIVIDEGVPARFFLSVMPLGSKSAVYESIGYQASHDADGLLTYKIRARFEDTNDMPRIGWTGVGKIYGNWTVLAANILRRPLVTLRRKLGI